MANVADPDADADWLAYAADLANNGYDAEAMIVRTYWPALRDTMATGHLFDAVMRDLRRHLWTLHDAVPRLVAATEVPPT
jgi:hypothetical protein